MNLPDTFTSEYISELLKTTVPTLKDDEILWCVTEISKNALTYIVDSISESEEEKQLTYETYALVKSDKEKLEKFSSILAVKIENLDDLSRAILNERYKAYILQECKDISIVIKQNNGNSI